MENASKALIIAGAILLAILIISLGIMIYNQASGVVNNNAMTEVEVSSFNQKFQQYFGENVRGANVNSLLNAVRTNNLSTDDDSQKVELVSAGSEGISVTTDGQVSGRAETGKTYKVEVKSTDYTTGGLISKITVTVNP